MTANPTKTLQMLYDQEGNLLFEADAATGEMLREYVWLQGRPVAVIDAAADSAIYAVHVDHLDRPVMMTNHAGAIVWRADYLPFGEVRTSSGQAALAYRFPGQWFMLETGLHYNWYRWYDASLGRYTQPDPIGMPDGPSRYAYALNSPLMYADPSGEQGKVMVPAPPIPLPGWERAHEALTRMCQNAFDALVSLFEPNPEGYEGCDEEWEQARQVCAEELSKPTYRQRRPKTGGYQDIEQCARGHVSPALRWKCD